MGACTGLVSVALVPLQVLLPGPGAVLLNGGTQCAATNSHLLPACTGAWGWAHRQLRNVPGIQRGHAAA